MIIVVDSGIWISAIQYGGIPRAAAELLTAQDTPASCYQIEDEVLGVLCLKFGHDLQRARDRFHSFLSEPLWIEVTGEISGICRDPQDDCILECALKAGADLIITGDKDLLVLGEFRGIRIITPRQYLDLPGAQ